MSLIAGSTYQEPKSTDTVQKQIVLPIIVFLSVPTLHWLVWQFIVPQCRLFGSNARSLIIYPINQNAIHPIRQSVFSKIIAFGYLNIALYCSLLGDHHTWSEHKNGQLTFGLILIGIGMAARLRCVIDEAQQQGNTQTSSDAFKRRIN